MQAINLIELIPRCHAGSRAKGFWDATPNKGQQLMLVVSELAEALEADRKGRRADLTGYEVQGATDPTHPAEFRAKVQQASFLENVKDTVEDELADAYIRLCDYAGGYGLDLQLLAIVKCDPATWAVSENFGEALLTITRTICDAKQAISGTQESDIADAMTLIECLCLQRGIDLVTHIDLKLAYNATRPRLHAKAY